MSDATTYDPYAMPTDAIQEPPATLWTAFRKIGPGIILAGSIVGSGELILTTSLGADWGYMFLWLILFSCVIKVFVQIELGRHAISSGKPTLGALNDLPGWRWRAHWQVWWWFFMLMATVVQLGAMVGGVGQALHLAFPKPGNWVVEHFGAPPQPAVAVGEQGEAVTPPDGTSSTDAKNAKKAPEPTPLQSWISKHPENLWSVFTALCAMALLLSGGYVMIEKVTTVLVVGVTAITVACVMALPATGYPITLADLAQGFDFHFPSDAAERVKAIAAAFAVFGITGVGASELYSYPYWCLEKGYARFAGPRSDDPEWARRANGWMRVMRLDAWISMVVFTVATVAFYLLGATVLHRENLHPQGAKLSETLAQMYVPSFGEWTKILFLIGAWAVLFKTLYVASAGHSRLTADFCGMIQLVKLDNAYSRRRLIRWFCVFYPLLALAFYLWIGEPKGMVKFGGFAQGVTLPVIAGATVYLRYRSTDRRIAPSHVSDICLWIAFVLLTLFAGKALWDNGAALWGWMSSK
ncbi:MAG: Nramp family divalent metal transporter [Planctomycetales bacterium]